ncbi:MAG TPA: hypothetical protein VFT16_02020 [Candidatus Saccharimonadales bacterium]|nr:hypothetical protein [Candidatus Saccharimonadales bacterium]
MVKPSDFEHRIQIANFDRQIAEMRLEQMQREKAQAEFQANWYENAPLSWLLRKALIAFDRAVATRMTRVAEEVPTYDTSIQVKVSEKITAQDLHVLSRSYERSVGSKVVGPTDGQVAIMRYMWLAYRIVRKAVKLVLRPVLSRRRGAVA